MEIIYEKQIITNWVERTIAFMSRKKLTHKFLTAKQTNVYNIKNKCYNVFESEVKNNARK